MIAGKYSTRKPEKPKTDASRSKCPNCPPHYRHHESNKCLAFGKTCAVCKHKNHFAGSRACQSMTVRALSNAQEETSYTYDEQTLSSIDIVKVGRIVTAQQDNTVSLHINGSQTAAICRFRVQENPYPNTWVPGQDGTFKAYKDQISHLRYPHLHTCTW